MARVYKNNWNAKKIVVNFNQKQWRQDLAAFVQSQLNWNNVRVTRSKIVNKDKFETNPKKQFEIYSLSNSCVVEYKNENEIISATYSELINDYLTKKI